MTHGEFPQWVTLLMTGLVGLALYATMRFSVGRIESLVNRLVPARFSALRPMLRIVIVLATSLAVVICLFTVFLIVLYALSEG